MSSFTPSDWYWRASDGRVFSSARQLVVSSADSAYAAWQVAGNSATAWPKDSEGNETTAALQEVLAPYSRFADLKAYAAEVRYRKETGGAVVNGASYLTDRETQAKMTAAVVMTQINPEATFEWKSADGRFVSLDAAAMLQVAQAVGAHVQAAFATESEVAAAIDTGAITTMAQIDAAFS
mgnify:CR=1 FL=1